MKAERAAWYLGVIHVSSEEPAGETCEEAEEAIKAAHAADT